MNYANNESHLVLVRGVSGSGKTTYVKHAFPKHVHYEADMYFIKDGVYDFDPTKIKDAHEWCYKNVTDNLLKGKMVAVSNTFTQLWEIQKYYDFCVKNNIPIVVVEMYTQYKNTHNVPESVIQRMKDRWEKIDWKKLEEHCTVVK